MTKGIVITGNQYLSSAIKAIRIVAERSSCELEIYMESSTKTAWLSILTNLLLVGIKTAVVFISGSLAVTADAIHSLSDVGSDI